MNGYARYAGSRKRPKESGTPGKLRAEAGNESGASDGLRYQVRVNALTRQEPMRLINASCKAFLIKRGLDPGENWQSRLLRASSSERV